MSNLNFKGIAVTIISIGLVIAIIACGILGLVDKNKSLTEKISDMIPVVTKDTVIDKQEQFLNDIINKQERLYDLAYSKNLNDLIIKAKDKGIDITKMEYYYYIEENCLDTTPEELMIKNEYLIAEYNCLFASLITDVDFYNLMYFPNSKNEFQNYIDDDANIDVIKFPYRISDTEPIDTNVYYIVGTHRLYLENENY